MGLPTVAGVRKGTLQSFERLRTDPGGFPDQSDQEAEIRANLGLSAWFDDAEPPALRLKMGALAGRMGVEQTLGGPLSAILLPCIDASATTMAVARMAGDEAARAVDDYAYGPAQNRGIATQIARHVLGQAAGPTGDQVHQPPGVPMFRMRIGPELYRHSAAEFLAELPR